MSISTSLGNALSGLSITSRMAEVTSNNIANALTEGYGRRSLEIGSSLNGVRSLGVQRESHPGLTADRRLAESSLGAGQRSLNAMSAIEAAVGTAGAPDGIAARLSAFEATLVSATADPSSQGRLEQVNAAFVSLVQSLNTASDKVQTLRLNADTAISRDIDALNAGLVQVAQLNADITHARSTGQDTSYLKDARQQVVDGLSGIVPLRVLQRDGDQIGLMTPQGMVLLDGIPSTFEFTPVNTVTPDMTFTSGGLSGISRNGIPIDLNDGIGRLAGGSLGASMELRDQSLVAAQDSLDEFALNLTQRFDNPTTDPTIGSVGILTDGGGAADPADFLGLAGRLAVNPAIDPNQGGDVSRWRDGSGATVAGPTGDAGQLNRWIDALGSQTALISGGASRSAAGHIATLASDVGANRLSSEKSLSFTQARWDSLHQAELATGVDSDRELQDLLRIEQAYAANAKVMQTISAMMQQLMEI